MDALGQLVANLPLTDAEQRIQEPVDQWSDDLALKIAVKDFRQAEAYRSQNHDWRWRVADELYLAWTAQKYWEGTKIPRASIPVFLVFQQVESLLPKLMSAIFADEPWFEALPGQGTNAAIARKFRDELAGQLDDAGVREVVRRGLKSALIYGNGITELSWINQKQKKIQWVPRWKFPQGQPMGDVKKARRVLEKRETETIENRPILDHISIKDFYVDPNLTAPSLQHPSCGHILIRAWKSIAFLESLRQNTEFKIPTSDDLIEMAIQKRTAQSDTTKSVVELMRFGYWAPQNDQTSDPAGKRIELVARVSKDRVVWVLNRDTVIFNKPNPYGFINYYSASYADVPDRFYGLSLCDVLEGEQRFRTSLLNGRIDELALSIHAPVQYKRGLNIPSYQLRTRPGQMIQVETPGEDYIRTEMGGITNNAYIEDQASDARSQKITGLSDLIAMGMPQQGGNSAGRTATGIGAQVQAGSTRIQGVLETLEDTYIEPMLNDLVTLNQLYPKIGTPAQELAMRQNVKLFMRASAKMKSQMALLQTLPLVMQSILNPAFLEHLAEQGTTINFNEFLTMLLDMTGYRSRGDLIMPMSPQQMQQRQAQQQQEAQVKMQMQRERIQGQSQIADKKAQHESDLQQIKDDNERMLEQMRMKGDLAKTLVPSLIDHVMGGGEGE